MSVQHCFRIFVAITLLPVAHALDEPLIIFIAASSVIFVLFICCGVGAFFLCRGRMGNHPRIGWGRYGHRNYDPVAMSVLNQAAMQQQQGYLNSPYQPATTYPAYQYPQYPQYPQPQQYPAMQQQATDSKLPDSQPFPTTNEPQPPMIQPPNLPYPPHTGDSQYPNTGAFPTAPPTSEVNPPTYSYASTQEKKY